MNNHRDTTARPTARRQIRRPQRPCGRGTKTAAMAVFTSLPPNPVLTTSLGSLYNCDCLDLLGRMADESADLFFADPPFNCGKDYGLGFDGRKINDRHKPEQYLSWCRNWLDEAIRVLKPGGALYVYNVAQWNMHLGVYLKSKGLRFNNWITVNINGQLPVRGKLLQQGYSMLYFTKGRPRTFNRILTPLRRCRRCNHYIKDYGGKLARFKTQGGTTLPDVWDDVTAVRHSRYKSALRGDRNQLSTTIVGRVIDISTRVGDLVTDVFGGSGTTFALAETMGRRWVGCELGSCAAAIQRLTAGAVVNHRRHDVVISDGSRGP